MVKNYLYTATYQLMVLLTPLLTVPYLSRILGAKQLGIYSYISTSSTLVTTICLLGLYSYGNRQIAYVRDDSRKCSQVFWEIFSLRILLAFLGGMMYLSYAFFNPSYYQYFLVYFPYLLAEFLDTSWFFMGIEKMRPAALKNSATKLSSVVGIFLIVHDANDLWKYLLLLALATLLTNLSLYPQLSGYLHRPNIQIVHMSIHLKASLKLFFPQMAAFVYFQLDKIMLQWLTGDSASLAYYDQATKIVMIPLTLVTLISHVTMPRVANAYQKAQKQLVQQLCQTSLTIILALALPMSLGLMCIARQLIPWYLGNGFQPVSLLLYILSPVLLLQALTSLSGNQYFLATNQLKIVTLSYCFSAGVNVCLNILLIPNFHEFGAAFATLFSAFLLLGIQYSEFWQQISVQSCVLAGRRYAFIALVTIIIVYGLTFNLPSSLPTTFKQIIGACLGYGGCLVVLQDPLFLLLKQYYQKQFKKKLRCD